MNIGLSEIDKQILVDELRHHGFLFYFAVSVIALLFFPLFLGFIIEQIVNKLRFLKQKSRCFQESIREGAVKEPRFVRQLTMEEFNWIRQNFDIKYFKLDLIEHSKKTKEGLRFVFFVLIAATIIGLIVKDLSLIVFGVPLLIAIILFIIHYSRNIYLDLKSPVAQVSGKLFVVDKTFLRDENNRPLGVRNATIIVRGLQFELDRFSGLSKLKNLETFIDGLTDGQEITIEYTPFSRFVLSAHSAEKRKIKLSFRENIRWSWYNYYMMSLGILISLITLVMIIFVFIYPYFIKFSP